MKRIIIIITILVTLGMMGTSSASYTPIVKVYNHPEHPYIGKLVYVFELTYPQTNGYNKKIIKSYVTKITKNRLYLKTYETVIIKRGNKITRTTKSYNEEEMR